VIRIGPDDLLAALQWVNRCLEKTPLSPKERKGVELALEEAIVNILRHGDAEEKLELRCEMADGKIWFELRDKGRVFNPLEFSAEHAVAQLEAPLEEREEGGLGILLIRAYIDELAYRREGEWNVLTMGKRLSL
jgi:anti-sigma regulatory factor (Ser/Thr protein kinase)